MGVQDRDHQILTEALKQVRKRLVEQIDALTSAEVGDDALAAAVLSAVVNVEAIREVAEHSRALVRLTRVLVALTAILAGITAVLAWRTFS